MDVQQLSRHHLAARRRGSLTGSGTSAPTDSFDVSKATVAQVVAHVEQHPEQLAAVVEAERAGRGRKGILALSE